jgi:cytochrome o ubiquinol oxidase subunit 2
MWVLFKPGGGGARVAGVVGPAATPVQFQLTSATVMNSFFVPQLGSQIYTMGGMVTRLNLEADRPGTYPGRSTNFSGDGFSSMQFETVALAGSQFDAWLRTVRALAGPLDAAQLARLAQPGVNPAPLAFGAVPPQLFEQIVDETAAGPPMPAGQAAAGEPEAQRCKAS